MTLKHLRNSWCGLAVLSSFLWAYAGIVQAQEAICDPQQPSHCSRPITKGEIAPFSGQLLSTELSIDLGLKATYCQKKIDLELKFQKKNLDLDLALEKELRDIDQKSYEAREKLLMKRLEESQTTHWYQHPAFVATVSVVTTFLLIWGARETLKAW